MQPADLTIHGGEDETASMPTMSGVRNRRNAIRLLNDVNECYCVRCV
jgi:hypothetical protein